MLLYFGKILVFIGLFLTLSGVIFLFGSKIPYFGKLPGDFYIKKGNFTFYAPITSFLILSIVLSIIVSIIFKIFK